MRSLVLVFFFLALFSCENKTSKFAPFTGVKVRPIPVDSLSIRAIALMQGNVVFAANKSTYGMLDTSKMKVKTNTIKTLNKAIEFRAVAHTPENFFMLSVENPALLYKTGSAGQMELVYTEQAAGVFYDALTFFDAKHGIAIGDAVGGCLSIILSNDGGNSWQKIPCEKLPAGIAEEGAYAASNTNIKTMGSKAWIATTAGNIYYTEDYGNSWARYKTPIVNPGIEAYGIYSIDFINDKQGIAYGGSFLDPLHAAANIATTLDGGQNWSLVAANNNPGYKSCVQYVPATNGKGIIAIGFTGISYSSDGGLNWTNLSKEPFYTFRFKNKNTAYAAGKGRMAKLEFY